jgi:hypothetical protein
VERKERGRERNQRTEHEGGRKRKRNNLNFQNAIIILLQTKRNYKMPIERKNEEKGERRERIRGIERQIRRKRENKLGPSLREFFSP